MSTRLLSATFKQLRASGRTALIPFIMGGDPDVATTRQLLLALDDAGADVIEVGIPFSDPLADGPVIQAASARALKAGATPSKVVAVIASIRQQLRCPVVCLSYWNPIVQFQRRGQTPQGRRFNERGLTPSTPFLRVAQRSGIAGLIIPDLPLEEGAALRRNAHRQGIDTIFLAAPTSPPARLRAIARNSTGFIYYVSVTGTTGSRHQLPPQLVQGVRQLKLLTTKPVCVGFGISTPRQAGIVAKMADGVIVGSALIQRIAAASSRAAKVKAAHRFVRQLRQAV